MQLRDLQKLTDVARVYDINPQTLKRRLGLLNEGVDYIKLGHRQPTILTPEGVQKIINIKDC